MSTYSREDLHTDRSIQLDSDSDSPQHLHHSTSIYLDKMEAHLAFMEKEFSRNIQWQKEILHQVRRDRKRQAAPQRRKDIMLHLKHKEEEKLKGVLRDYCNISNDRLNLSQLIKLAASLKDKCPPQHERQKERDVSFPLLPRVITLNDLAPSTQRHLDSSKVSPIKMVESRVKVPKYRKAAKNPHQLFSPQSEEPTKMVSVKYRLDEPPKQDHLKDSLEKRLEQLQGNNFVTFREYDSLKNKLSENVSLNFSSSRQEEHSPASPNTEKESLLLYSDDEEPLQNPSIYLQLQLTKQSKLASKVSRPKKEEILCFNATKKRKIGRSKDRILQNLLPPQDDSKMRLKKLHDSFGKIYHEYEQGKHANDPNWKPNPQNDRETLESDD